MFRTDRDALAQEVEELRRQRAELQTQNEAMRADLLARRAASPPAPGAANVYRSGTGHLSPGERVALARHGVEAFPVWAAVLLHFLTLGLFPLEHFSLLHDKLPAAEHDDPGAGKAIGFSFIPYFNFYWIVFNVLRLTDRVNLQFRLRGQPDQVPRGLMMVTAVLSLVPYLNGLVTGLILWPIAIVRLQRAVNALAALPRDGSDAAGTAWSVETAPPVPLRIPKVQDLPGPAEVADHDAEIEAAAIERPRRAVL